MNEATERGLALAAAKIKRAHQAIHQMGGLKPSTLDLLPDLIERISNEIDCAIKQKFYSGAIKQEDMAAVLEFIENWQPSEELMNRFTKEQHHGSNDT